VQEIGMQRQQIEVDAQKRRHRLGVLVVHFGASLMLVGLVVLLATQGLPGVL
jgi:hypothetical protein